MSGVSKSREGAASVSNYIIRFQSRMALMTMMVMMMSSLHPANGDERNFRWDNQNGVWW